MTTFFSFSNSFSFLEKDVDMDKLQTDVDLKILVINKLTHISKEKDKSIKTWEGQCAKDAASHDDEVKKLDSRLVGKNSLLTTSFIY